jgi:hypothetical protein
MRARVAMLSGEGDSLRAIAERLGVTQRTVRLEKRLGTNDEVALRVRIDLPSANESGTSAILRSDARNSRAGGLICAPTGTGDNPIRSIAGLMRGIFSVRE